MLLAHGRRFFFALVVAFALANLAAASIITIQPVRVDSAINTTANDLLFANAIFAQTGETVQMKPLLTSTTLPSNMVTSGGSANLSTYLGDSTFQAPPVLTVWYVPTIDGGTSTRGVSFEISGKYGIGISDSHVNDTLSHEIAHILLNFVALWQQSPTDAAHSTDAKNLLASGDIRNVPGGTGDVNPNGLKYDQIQPVQADAMARSQFEVPEPATPVLCGAGLLILFVRRRASVN